MSGLCRILTAAGFTLIFILFLMGGERNVAVHPSLGASLSSKGQQPEQQEITLKSPTSGWQKHVNLSFMSLGLIL